MNDLLNNSDEYVSRFYEKAANYGYEIEAKELYELYLEECEDEGVKPTFGLSVIEECLKAIKEEEGSTCNPCVGCGCSYCLMMEY